ncbi:MAG: tripartite tricarboxylate transporter substrate binding protein [Betaproteobacteria bacterium]|nr:MAG: tripartite tricarboxylate transporter substrate binding protein [Betaproteobacteria bacterium]
MRSRRTTCNLRRTLENENRKTSCRICCWCILCGLRVLPRVSGEVGAGDRAIRRRQRSRRSYPGRHREALRSVGPARDCREPRGCGRNGRPRLGCEIPPDGYTLLANSSAHTYGAELLTNHAYDPLKDFIPIAPLAKQPFVLVVGKSAGVKTVGELIAAAKAKPGEFKFSSAGVGTATHLGVEKFNLETGIKAIHVPLTPTQAITDTIAGRITYWMSPISLALPQIREGRLMGLGVSSAQRSSILPEVPTLGEAGVSGFDFTIWYGIWAPVGTPARVVNKLAKSVARAVAEPDVRERLAKNGADPMSMTQTEFVHFVATEHESAARVIRAAGIKPR